MNNASLHTIAICYDYDGTLIEGNMQENSFIPEIGMEKQDFWELVKTHAKNHDMDEVLSYMKLMLDKAKEQDIKLNKNILQKHGEKVTFFPGVEQWFDIVNSYGKKQKAEMQHFIISSGIDAMIQGSSIGKKFKHIFASGFMYDPDELAFFPARSINYTTKVQYLFRINKGILDSWDNSKINQFTPEEKRPMPFSQMIYVGDGETDIPAMKMINYQGGYSIAVFPPKKGQQQTKIEKEKQEKIEKLQQDGRCQFIAEADYSKDRNLYNIVTALIDRIVNELEYNMNLKAR